jgi:hypothetical protein
MPTIQFFLLSLWHNQKQQQMNNSQTTITNETSLNGLYDEYFILKNMLNSIYGEYQPTETPNTPEIEKAWNRYRELREDIMALKEKQ